MPEATDRRVLRTRELLRTALVALIRERGFEDLTVQDIIDRANVGRATFYAHFDNKEDLLVSGFEDLKSSLKKLQRQAHLRGGGVDERAFGFSYEVFAHTNEYRDVFQSMVGKQSGAMVQQILYRILLELVRDDLKAIAARQDSIPDESAVQFVTGGLFGLLMWWLKGRERLSVEEINRLFHRLARPVLKGGTL